MLEVHSEHRERGIIERRYQLQSARAVIEADAAKVFTVADHRRAVTAVVGALLTEFDNYVRKDATDTDFVGYPQLSLWLTDEELQTMIEEFRAAVRSRTANRPGEGRRRYLLTSVLFPAAD